MRVVVIGGVAGGMSFATRFRRLNEDAEIIVLEKGPYVSFANCGLPYYVSGEIAERDALIVQTPEMLNARFQIDVRVESEAIKIDGDGKVVSVKHGDEVYDLSYDKLLLSPGAKPMVPNITGINEAENLFTLRNVPDVDRIMAFIASNKPRRAVVIGAGFIGVEMAENLAHRGLDVSLVEMAPQVLPPLDEEMARMVENELQSNGIHVMTGVGATAFEDKGHRVVLNDGSALDTDLVILSIGVVPDSMLAQEAGVAVGMRGGILVDDAYMTNIQDIYAVGDAIIVKHFITGEDAMIALASPANRQGRQAADVMSGIDRKNRGSLGTSVLRAFNIAAASTGLNERQLKALNYDYAVVHVTGNNHAGYYPNATPIFLKLLFNRVDGTLYGAQAVGEDGAEKRIDVIATAIKGKMNVEDLIELELSYAPPFGTAKDVVNMAGYAALNIIEGYTDTIQWHEIDVYRQEGATLIDVRNTEEIDESGLVDGFVNIPLHFLRCRMHEIPADKPVIVACRSGQRSYAAGRILQQAGYDVKNLDGAFLYQELMYPESVRKEGKSLEL